MHSLKRTDVVVGVNSMNAPIRNLIHAAATVIVGPWSAEQALPLIECERTTKVVLVLGMLNSLLESSMLGGTDISSM
jgi:hypothetical protein